MIPTLERRPASTAPLDPPSSAATPTAVVASIVMRENRLALFRRSAAVTSDVGLWHCVTGFVEPGLSPLEQARRELTEEAGYDHHVVAQLKTGAVLTLPDHTGHTWHVHCFRLDVSSPRVHLNWEHDSVRWVPLEERDHLPCVPWLDNVLEAVA